MSNVDARLRRALVTGASGFVGRQLCVALQRAGWDVSALQRREVRGPWTRVYRCDLGADAVPANWLEDVDAVFHLAANAHAINGVIPAQEHQRISVAGTRELLAAASAAHVTSMVYVSSVKAIGDPGARCVDETYTVAPQDDYGRAKRAAEELVLDWGRETGGHAVVLRPSLVIGRGVKGNLQRMLEAVDRGRFPPLAVRSNRRSLLHVADLISALVISADAENVGGKTYFLCHPDACSTRHLFDEMRAALGKAPVRFSIPSFCFAMLAQCGDFAGAVRGARAPFDSEHWRRLCESACYDSSRFCEDTGFVFKHTIADGLRDMCAGADMTKAAGEPAC